MHLYSRALKHIDMKCVKNLHENKIAEQIALAEKQYLLYFAENTIPKYYDWETGQFNVTPLAEIKETVLKRLEEIEDALSEGMKMKNFKYLYGNELGSQILSISPTLVSSTFAQDLISASGEVTSHMFGPDFPGSHINSIGDFNPQSYSKVDVVATASWNSVQDVTPSGWTPENSYEYVSSASDVVSPGQETDTFKDTHFGEVTISGTDISLSTGNDDGEDNTVDIEDLKTLFPGTTFPKGVPDQHGEVYDPTEASMILRTFKSVSAGQVISFDYSFTSLETEEDTAGIIGPTGLETIQSYRGANREISGGDSNADDYGFVLVGNSVEKIVSVFAKDGNNSDFNFTDVDGQFKPEILQSRFPLTGNYSYTVKQSDIDSHGNLKFFIGVMDGDGGSFESNLDITNLSIDSSMARVAAGQLGKTTDAFDLGTSVASLDPNKKKKEKEQEERRRKFEQERLKKDKEYKKKEEERKKKEEEKKRKEEVKKKEAKSKTSSTVQKETEAKLSKEKYKLWKSNYDNVLKYNPDLTPEQAGKIAESIPEKLDPSIPFRIDADATPDEIKAEAIKSYPRKENKNGQTLANPGEPSDRLGLLLRDGESEDDFHYYKGHRYGKGSLQDTGIPIGTYPKYVGDGKDMPYVHDYKPGYVYSNLQVTFSSDEMKKKFEAHKNAMKEKYKNKSNAWWASQPYHLNSLWKVIVSTPFPGARPFVAVGEQAPAESDGLEGLLDSENLKNKYGEGLFAEFGKIYQKLNTIKDAGKAFAAFLLQQQGVNKLSLIHI